LVQRDFEREVLEVVDSDPFEHDRIATGVEVHPEQDTGWRVRCQSAGGI
jgi:hypothetical protein